MASKLSIYNGCLRQLGVTRLLSVTEDRSDRRELDAAYNDALLYMLELGNWKFAMRSAELTEDPSLSPAFGTRTSAFNRPDDYVRLTGFGTDENFQSEANFRQEGNIWYVYQSPAWVRYVSKDPAYGLNLGLYPVNYALALEGWLAHLTAMPITKDPKMADRALLYHQKWLAKALELEAITSEVKFPPRGNWAASRGFGRGNVSFPVPGKMHIRG